MSCCPIRACRDLLVGHEYVLFEAVVRWLITQRTPVLKREPWFVPHARPYGQTVLKSELRWSVTWWRGVAFYYCRPADRWVLAGGIDRCPIATPDHADSLGFVAWISLRANTDDRIVINGVPISGRVRPSIEFVVAGCLTTAWNMVTEFLRYLWNSKLIVVMRRSSCSWAGRSRLSSFSTVNGSIPNSNRMSIRNFS
jgi:hypothetical protein